MKRLLRIGPYSDWMFAKAENKKIQKVSLRNTQTVLKSGGRRIQCRHSRAIWISVFLASRTGFVTGCVLIKRFSSSTAQFRSQMIRLMENVI